MLLHTPTILICYGRHFESKMSAKIQKSSDLDEIWFPSRLWCCELISTIGLLWWPFWIQNDRQNIKLLWFGGNLVWYRSLVCYDGHFESKMAAKKIQRSFDMGEMWFPSRLWCCELISIVDLLWRHLESKMAAKIQRSFDMGEIWFPSRLWCCELISIFGLLWWLFWIQNGHQNTKTQRFGKILISK